MKKDIFHLFDYDQTVSAPNITKLEGHLITGNEVKHAITNSKKKTARPQGWTKYLAKDTNL